MREIGTKRFPIKSVETPIGGSSVQYNYIIYHRVTLRQNPNLLVPPRFLIFLLENQAIGSQETFIWNDRFVMSGTDELQIYTEAATDIDVYCSYIDQQLA